MALRRLHKILILSALALGVLSAGYTTYRWLALDDSSLLPTGAIGAISAIALGFYYRWFTTKRR